MSLTLFDIIVIGVILVSAVLAMVRGFVREVLSVASWLIAAIAAFYLYQPLRDVAQPYIENETLATVVSVAVIFIVVLVIASYITMKIADFVIDSRVGSFDRLFGFLFGAARGLLLVVVAFAFFVWLVDDQPDWIANAQTRSVLLNLSEQLAGVLPEDIEAELLARLRGEDLPAGEPEVFDDVFPLNDGAGAGLDGDGIEQVIIGNEAAP